MARSTFYYHQSKSNITDKYIEYKRIIHAIYHENKGRYGYRRIALEIRRRGYVINSKTVFKLMHSCGLKCMVRIKKYRSYKGEYGKIAPNLLLRDFIADKPNQKWVTDITQFEMFGVKCFLSPIMDLYNREIISYTVSYRPTFNMVADMLKKAFRKVPDNTNLILHSDQGWHYQHQTYQRLLREKGVIQSMSRKGNCLDNAVIENFFGLLKSELLYLRKFTSIEEFIRELNKYIKYYNTKRIKLNLNGFSPVQYRKQNLITVTK